MMTHTGGFQSNYPSNQGNNYGGGYYNNQPNFQRS